MSLVRMPGLQTEESLSHAVQGDWRTGSSWWGATEPRDGFTASSCRGGRFQGEWPDQVGLGS